MGPKSELRRGQCVQCQNVVKDEQCRARWMKRYIKPLPRAAHQAYFIRRWFRAYLKLVSFRFTFRDLKMIARNVLRFAALSCAFAFACSAIAMATSSYAERALASDDLSVPPSVQSSEPAVPVLMGWQFTQGQGKGPDGAGPPGKPPWVPGPPPGVPPGPPPGRPPKCPF